MEALSKLSQRLAVIHLRPMVITTEDVAGDIPLWIVDALVGGKHGEWWRETLVAKGYTVGDEEVWEVLGENTRTDNTFL
jgi:hypothetical protein